MSASSKSESVELKAAFAALKTYDQGSSRAALLPIDEAVIASLDDRTARNELERRLVAVLESNGSAVAREYACLKLALIGSKSCVPVLAVLLDTPEVATAARTALEAISNSRAAKALRDSLPELQGAQKIGAINSLGARRDAASVRDLAKLLNAPDLEIASAAAAAVGKIGTTRAARALREFQPKAPDSLQQNMADACLVCAEHLLADGKHKDAEVLYNLVSATAKDKHVQLAAAGGLERAAARK